MSRLDRFEDSVADLGGTVERVERPEATEALEAAIDPPTVGVPLAIEGVSLPESVTTPPTPSSLGEASTGLTGARFAIASLGSLAIPSTPAGDEPVSLFGDRHVAVIEESAILPNLEHGFEQLEAAFAEGSTSLVLATGRSSTADMGALIHGVHGPAEVHVIVVRGETDE